jgi:hypothetical protein
VDRLGCRRGDCNRFVPPRARASDGDTGIGRGGIRNTRSSDTVEAGRASRHLSRESSGYRPASTVSAIAPGGGGTSG